MTRRLELEQHRHSIGEIREIMNSMKTLAYMETRKLSRHLDTQRALTESIHEVAADFLSFHPETLPGTKEEVRVYIVIGSERGFCGDINQRLLVHLEQIFTSPTPAARTIIVVGSKLHSLLERDFPGLVFINGANVAEEIAPVLSEISEQLTKVRKMHAVMSVYGLHYSESEQLVMSKILPPFEELLFKPPRFSIPPILNLTPADFLIELTEQYLLATLYEMFYTTLMVENRSRVVHLEGAVKRLDDISMELSSKVSSLRQEEITEEIEVILLNADRVRRSRL